jgi:hypothetical protein
MGSRKSATKHTQLVVTAVDWLRGQHRCGIILSEQYCVTGETPDAIGWKGACHSVVIECKVSRSDFLADATKPFRVRPEEGLGCERWYMARSGLITPDDLPKNWGLLEISGKSVRVAVKPSRKNLRTEIGLLKELNLLLASLRRVELRIEPQTITEFLKWKNRMADYNGGAMPKGLAAPEQEENVHLAVGDV